MQFNPYGGAAAQIAVAVVNAGPNAGSADFEKIIEEHDYRPAKPVSDAGARELAAWSLRLRTVFDEPELDVRVKLTNQLLAIVAAPPYITQHDSRSPHFHYADTHAPIVARIKTFTAMGLAHAICDDAGRIGRCDRSGCAVVYVDTSRNGRRRFCSAQCANRTHVAEHRSRRKDGAIA
ncbi:CGNR zinc finger protein [Herbihabitans rhizosphaerae]|uniref:CGNR zinc finger protein n=1 Tax=Herbihabitans rhizosphaerae TaxID=1872711 RepID=A0A4Q7KIN0_9PSEU|nr:CGNR zinc finger domain-containing protein [Herbihabitans rhizosphaerae]RZS34788.1 CGNR zinc finger protein [Herbihabitans rhizosphaerae]